MLIDWFTIVAQVINFLVLVALLKRFLYGPIIKAMDEREANIAASLQEAEEKVVEARQEAEVYRQQQAELAEQREALLAEARTEAEARRHELMNQARAEVAETRTKWYEAIQHEKDAFLQDLRRLAGQQVFAIVRRTLTDLANADLEQQVIEVFLARIQKLDERERAAIAKSIHESGQKVVIQSAFDIPPKARSRVIKTVRDQIGDKIEVKFEKAPDLICGLALKGHNYKMTWSLERYWEELEASLAAAMEGELMGKGREVVIGD